jgi:fatty-acyl-CoA synthase
MTPLDTARRHALGDLLRRSALREGGKTAIVYARLRQSYADLDAVVNRSANG